MNNHPNGAAAQPNNQFQNNPIVPPQEGGNPRVNNNLQGGNENSFSKLFSSMGFQAFLTLVLTGAITVQGSFTIRNYRQKYMNQQFEIDMVMDNELVSQTFAWVGDH